MEGSDEQTMSYTQSNPLFGMTLSSNDLYSFEPDHLKPARPRPRWCLRVIVVYLVLQTALNAFLIYKVFTLEASLSSPMLQKLTSNEIPLDGAEVDFQTLLHNNSQETRTLRGHVRALQSKVNSLWGEEGQLDRLKSGCSLLNTTIHNLEGRLTAISLTTGPRGPPGTDGRQGASGEPGQKGPRGESGDVGPRGPAGEKGNPGEPGVVGTIGAPGINGTGVKGERGEPGAQGPRGEKGDMGNLGQKGESGPRGFNGSEGLPGPHGPKGDKGDRGNPPDVNVRLVPGQSRGRVEVKYNHVWGTVCDDSFDTVDGNVICKTLGFQRAVSTYTAGSGSGRIWLDDLQCTGTESDIFNCPHNGIGVNNCQHSEDAGLQCA